MAHQQKNSPYHLETRRRLPFARDRVFQAWTQPAVLQQWFHPAAQISTPTVEVDLRVGGHYRITMQNADQQTFTVRGVYQVIDPPAHLAFTWRWEGESAEPETLVTLAFIEHSPQETEIVLTHRGFVKESERNSHEVGWQGTLQQLAELPAYSNRKGEQE